MLSEETKRLMKKEEDIEVEYKREISSGLAKSLVSFANSKYGGFILIGVEETIDKCGRQRGQLHEGRGIKLSDENKTKIQNILVSCRDNLPAEVIEEEKQNGYGIYKIKTPPRTDKLYCTGGGRYVIRINGRSQEISPSLMRRIIMGANKPNLKLYFLEYGVQKTSLTVQPEWKVKIKVGKNEQTINPLLGIGLSQFNTSWLNPTDETQDKLPSVEFQLVNEGTSSANEIHVFIAFPESFELFHLPEFALPGSTASPTDEDYPYRVKFCEEKLIQGLAVKFGKVGIKPPREKHSLTYPVLYEIFAEESQSQGKLSLCIDPTFKEVKIQE